MDRYVRSTDVEAAPMLEETILFSPATKQFCVLNPTAAFVWERLVQPHTAEAMEASMRQAFVIDGAADVSADVKQALMRFEALKLVQRVSDG